ncbi:MAG TPA: CRISPR-associated endonuclease Cas1 [candidate division Zixibacteria bacterium]|nr:CRISPR-associated endonuclease Cas1 [candidate division Zixibacteria bacterium]
MSKPATQQQTSLTFITLEFTLIPHHRVQLPPHPGSTLRGLLTEALKADWHRFSRDIPPEENTFWRAAFGLESSGQHTRPYSLRTPDFDRLVEAGKDGFTFSLVLFGTAAWFWQPLIELIAWWGQQTEHRRVGGRFNGNYDLSLCRCPHSGAILYESGRFSGGEPRSLGWPFARARWSELGNPSRIDLDLKSPLWLRRLANDRRREYRYFDLAAFMSNLTLRLNRLSECYGDNGCFAAEVDTDTIRVTDHTHDLSWGINSNRDRTGGKVREPTRGLVGTVTLEGDLSTIGPWLVLGSLIGVCKGTPQGLGQYDLHVPESDNASDSAVSLFDQVIEAENLQAAQEKVLADDRHEDDPLVPDLIELSDSLHEGTYRPAALHGVVLPKAAGGFRFLAVPGLEDRIVQRAVLHVLRPIVARTLEQSSYAFRLGRSRYDAARMIDRLRSEGYEYVVDADISHFFDSVDHDLLMYKLRRIVDDPRLIELIDGWVKAPVRFARLTLERDRGLPQGMVLSPILSNIYLDEFDERMERAGYRIVRYADDFIILCRTGRERSEALAEARVILMDIGLLVSDKKTRLTSFREGFDYLGFLFLNSIMMEQPQKQEPDNLSVDDAEVIRELEKLGYHLKTGPPMKIEHFPELLVKKGAPLYRTLWLDTPGARAWCRAGVVTVSCRGAELLNVPLAQIGQIMVTSSAGLSPGLVNHCLSRGVPVIYMSYSGDYLGRLASEQVDPTDVWEKQLSRSLEPEFCVEVARELIAAKIGNLREVLRRHKSKNPALQGAWEDLGRIAELAAGVRSIDTLRGLEGRASAVYFGVFANMIDSTFDFPGRNRRPPRDPVNVLLSLGYTVLRGNVHSLVEKAGLSPYIGFLHMRRKGHPALVSDMMEPFRFLVDQTVIRLINRRQVRPNQFKRSLKSSLPCLMEPAARRNYLSELETKLGERVDTGANLLDWRRVMDGYCESLKEHINGGNSAFQAFRLRL